MPSIRAPGPRTESTVAPPSLRQRRILFVDDDELVLRSLERLLKRPALERKWEIAIASDAARALEIIAHTELDVVIVDAHMPKVSGIALLRQIQEHYPEVARIILSGEASAEMLRNALSCAHQFLIKPCDAAELCRALEDAYSLRDILASHELRQIVGVSNDLPSPPRLYFEISNALMDPRASTRKVAELVQLDVGLSARIMQLVSSAAYGSPRSVTSLGAAVAFLGVDVVRALVLSIEVGKLFPLAQALPEFSLQELQVHAVRVARLAKRIAPRPLDPSVVTVAAMLQDVGQLILASRATQRFAEALRATRSGESSLLQAELPIFGVTHAEVGAFLLGLWGIPEAIVRAVAQHLEPQRVQVPRFDTSAVLYLANQLLTDPDIAAREGLVRGERALDLGFLRAIGAASELPEFRRLAREILTAS